MNNPLCGDCCRQMAWYPKAKIWLCRWCSGFVK